MMCAQQDDLLRCMHANSDKNMYMPLSSSRTVVARTGEQASAPKHLPASPSAPDQLCQQPQWPLTKSLRSVNASLLPDRHDWSSRPALRDGSPLLLLPLMLLQLLSRSVME
jgi:hypothetical protein